MALMRPKNEVESTLASAFTRGSSTTIDLDDASDFPSTGVVRIDDGNEWCLLRYSGVSGNSLTGLSDAEAVNVSSGGATYTWPIGTAVALVQASDYINHPLDHILKGGLIFDVTEYGAIGDGTTDDTSAIQAAIDAAASSGGGVVFFPPGEYLISSTLSITSDNIALIGVAKGSASTIHYTGTGTAVSISGTRSAVLGNIYVGHLHIVGDGQSNSIGLGFSYVVVNSAVEHLFVYNFDTNISLQACWGLSLLHVHSAMSVTTGILVTNDPTDGGRSNSVSIIHPYVRSQGVGIQIKESFNCVILGGVIESCNPTGIWIDDNAHSTLIQGVYFENIANQDILLWGSSGEGYEPTNIHIGSCYFEKGATATLRRINVNNAKNTTIWNNLIKTFTNNYGILIGAHAGATFMWYNSFEGDGTDVSYSNIEGMLFNGTQEIGASPVQSAWPDGSVLFNTADNKVYVKIRGTFRSWSAT